jgi:hypothetical protein
VSFDTFLEDIMRKIGKALIMFVIGMLLCVSPVYALVQKTSAIIPVTCTGKCILTLSSVNSSEEKQTKTLDDEKGQFILTFEKPGNYAYTLSDQTGKSYQVLVVVTNGNEGTLQTNVVATLDGKHKDTIRFGKQKANIPQPIKPAENINKPTPQKTKTNKHLFVLTGDSTHIAIWVVTIVQTALMIIMLLRHRRREE